MAAREGRKEGCSCVVVGLGRGGAHACVPFNSQGEATDAEGDQPPRSQKSQADKRVRPKQDVPLPLISLKSPSLH